jgi:hypothetical protein
MAYTPIDKSTIILIPYFILVLVLLMQELELDFNLIGFGLKEDQVQQIMDYMMLLEELQNN